MALLKHARLRRAGEAATGGRKGTANKTISDRMHQIRDVADLELLQRSKQPAKVTLMMESIKALVQCKLIPQAAVPPVASVHAAHTALLSQSCSPAESHCNQHLLKSLWALSRENSSMRPYLDLVVRLWLISPPESVVESMASVIQTVFDTNRDLDHSSAAVELSIRWNGPSEAEAGPLLRAVQKRNRHKFRRVGSSVRSQFGTVMTRHRETKTARSTLLKFL